MDNILRNLEVLKAKAAATGRMLGLEGKKEKVRALRARMSEEGFWNDRDEAVRVSKEAESLDQEIMEWEIFSKDIEDLRELIEIGREEGDDSLEADIAARYEFLEKRFAELEFFILFSGKYDESSAIISIHAGTGGVDAQDWAEMLERMFLRFAERKGWRADAIERTIANEAGIKSAMYKIEGRWAYGHLKSESGVHRLVRISPFDAEALRQTSFALVEVIPEIAEAAEVEIRNEDLEVDTFRSSGAGGQHVNKTESAIRIKHIPTGIVVACQTERSQHQNRELAMQVLRSKLAKLQEEAREREEKGIKGEVQKAEWGKQIRSYVLQPYQMVKDHRTQQETSDVVRVLDGGIDDFIEAFLRKETEEAHAA